MDVDIITFDKNFKQRLNEYRQLFNTSKVLPASQMKAEWSYIAELVLEPIGWKAVWKIPAEKRLELKGVASSVALVTVENVDTKELTAEVNILNGKDKGLPEQTRVFLVDLYPTKQQVNEELYVNETADFIDKLRFFYRHLWMPWDIDDEENQNWINNHLETRLKLIFDMRSSGLPSEMVLQIQYLISEGRRIQSKIADLEECIEDDMNDEKIMCNLLDLHHIKDQIKMKFEMYEDPFKRSLLLWKHCHKTEVVDEENDGPKTTHLISCGGFLNSVMKFLNEAKSLISDDANVKLSQSLQLSVNEAAAGDAVVLEQGQYGLLGLGALETGGSIRGVGTPEQTVLKPHNAGNILLDCSGGIVTLENLTVDIEDSQIGLLVHDATLHLRNCCVKGTLSGACGGGLVVLKGGCIVAQDCTFSGLGSALAVYPKGEASLTACKIQNCLVGVKVQDDAKLSLMKCEISECIDFGIKVEISRKITSGVSEVDSALLLSSIGEIQLSDTNIKSNLGGDVCIVQRNNNNVPLDQDDSPSFSFLLFNNPSVISSEKHSGQGDL